MAEFSIRIKPSAVREIESIPRKQDRQAVLRCIARLMRDPHPAQAQKLSCQDRYRLWQVSYAIIYALEGQKVLAYAVNYEHK